jgi:hypothetical protein
MLLAKPGELAETRFENGLQPGNHPIAFGRRAIQRGSSPPDQTALEFLRLRWHARTRSSCERSTSSSPKRPAAAFRPTGQLACGQVRRVESGFDGCWRLPRLLGQAVAGCASIIRASIIGWVSMLASVRFKSGRNWHRRGRKLEACKRRRTSAQQTLGPGILRHQNWPNAAPSNHHPQQVIEPGRLDEIDAVAPPSPGPPASAAARCYGRTHSVRAIGWPVGVIDHAPSVSSHRPLSGS